MNDGVIWTDETLNAYAAGYFDGEGSVAVYKNGTGRSFNNLLTITNTDRVPLDRLCARFGGTVRQRTWSTTNRRSSFQWDITGAAAEEFARAILPYALTKAEQLRAFLEFRTLSGIPGCYSDRLALCDAIREMKVAPCL